MGMQKASECHEWQIVPTRSHIMSNKCLCPFTALLPVSKQGVCDPDMQLVCKFILPFLFWYFCQYYAHSGSVRKPIYGWYAQHEEHDDKTATGSRAPNRLSRVRNFQSKHFSKFDTNVNNLCSMWIKTVLNDTERQKHESESSNNKHKICWQGNNENCMGGKTRRCTFPNGR